MTFYSNPILEFIDHAAVRGYSVVCELGVVAVYRSLQNAADVKDWIVLIQVHWSGVPDSIRVAGRPSYPTSWQDARDALAVRES